MKALRFFIRPTMMGILFVVLAIAMAVATFIENDYGQQAARAAVYNSRWFELLFLLLTINLIGQIFVFRLWRRAKLTVMLFHVAFVIMLAGAAITRYGGYDGMMHIREGEASSHTFSSGNTVAFSLASADGTVLASHTAPFSTAGGRHGSYRKKLEADNIRSTLTFVRYHHGTSKKVEEAPGGTPMISFIATPDMVSSQRVVLAEGEAVMIGNMSAGFGIEADIKITADNDGFFISSIYGVKSTRMQEMISSEYPADSTVRVVAGTVYTIGSYRLMPQQMTRSGIVVPAPGAGEGTGGALEFTLAANGTEKRIYLWENYNEERTSWQGALDEVRVTVSYGAAGRELPFALRLDNFIVERYPGSNSPSGFISKVTVVDSAHSVNMPYDIYMNHILKYRGYRFYQSSYDRDEMGTVLSVNHDPAGMYTTYTGYGILFLFIILSLLNRKTFFNTVTPGHWISRFRRPALLTGLLLLLPLAPLKSQNLVIEKKTADEFGSLLVQDQKGRTKPLYTISSDIVRKVSRKNSFGGMSPMQVLLGCTFDFYHWQNVPLIKVSNNELRRVLNLTGDMAAFSQIVTMGEAGGYRLSALVDSAYAKSESSRSRFDKEVIKVDERVNIVYMMSRGDFLRLFPLRDDTDHWGVDAEAAKQDISSEDSLFVVSVLPHWLQTVTTVGRSVAVPAADYITAIRNYQQYHADYHLPGASKVKAELFYYKAKIFERLFPWYSALGLIMIVVIITLIIRGHSLTAPLLKVLAALVAAGFLFHTLGLGIRWYISGHSPMSNGYESLLFISWVTLLAGIIFSRRSLLTLAATSVLGGLTLMVAHLSFMDPEITNLVPVLRSYWLTLHVSVITGSYGFLGLGAILGMVVLIMMLFIHPGNSDRISAVIDELTVINYRSLTLGLYFLTIGTFLGAVWANESWGRYWGWDPKETWSLITMVVYTLVIHSRMMPGMKDTYIFNLLALVAFSSVLMTYFGVNYYLSGLHSYAGGDSLPVPSAIYVALVVVTALAVAAGVKYNGAGTLKPPAGQRQPKR